jgi:hypothetical protein
MTFQCFAPSLTITALLSAPVAGAQPVTTHPRLWVTAQDPPRLRSWAVSSNPNPGTPDGGNLYLWLMDGPTVIGGTGYTNSQADETWQIQGVGDLNGDGKEDIVWRNVGGPDMGALFVWLMDGPTVVGGTGYPNSQADFTWDVKAPR